MATKWKNFPNWFYYRIWKILAAVMAVICVGSILIAGAYLYTTASAVSLSAESYLHSKRRGVELENVASDALELIKQYRSEAFIRSGGTVDMQQLKKELIHQYSEVARYPMAEDEKADRTRTEPDATTEEKILAEHAEELEKRKQKQIMEDLQQYFALVEALNAKEGVYYYATDGQNVIANVAETTSAFFRQQPAYLLFDSGKTEHDALMETVMQPADVTAQDQIYVAFSQEYVAQRETEFLQGQALLNRFLVWAMLMAAVAICEFLYLLFAAGRRAGQADIQLCPVDHLYTDLAVVLGLLIAVVMIVAEDGIAECFESNQALIQQERFFVIGLCAAVYGGAAAEVVLGLSLVRQWKAKQFFAHSLIGTVVRKLCKGIRKLYEKIAMWIQKGPILVVSSQQLSSVREGVQRVKDGNLECRIDLPPGKALFGLAQDINAMSDGLQKAVEKELKAERLKTELITNVSHDLKTPLTSIINYSGLLTKETLTPDYANDYAKILKQKSDKLKQLTDDLFEISKAQSGNMQLHPEVLQVKVLVTQALAEYEEKLREAGLQLRVSDIPDDWRILADGKKMGRVLENLVVNLLKYAQPQTRVYVDVTEQDGMCRMTLKNIANYEMHFQAEEIVQRFTRGDASRTTEGNGLGLAIVQSYVEACGGTFCVDVDGDLFKATVAFTLIQD